jgi:hypothetical protein
VREEITPLGYGKQPVSILGKKMLDGLKEVVQAVGDRFRTGAPS